MANMEKLLTIQSKLNVPKSRKHRLGYSFRSADDILSGVKPLLEMTKTILILCDDDIVPINEKYMRLTTTACLYDAETGEEIQRAKGSVCFSPEDQTGAKCAPEQQAGKASSYARKYALNGLFAIDDEQDADATGEQVDSRNYAAQGARPKQAEPPQTTLFKRLTNDKIDVDEFMSIGWAGHFTKETLPREKAEDALKNYGEYVKKFFSEKAEK